MGFTKFHTSRYKEEVVDTQWYCPFLPQTLYWQVHGGSYLACVLAPCFVNGNITAQCILKAAMRHFINNSYTGWQSCSSLRSQRWCDQDSKSSFLPQFVSSTQSPAFFMPKTLVREMREKKDALLLRLFRPQHVPEYQTDKARSNSSKLCTILNLEKA